MRTTGQQPDLNPSVPDNVSHSGGFLPKALGSGWIHLPITCVNVCHVMQVDMQCLLGSE